MTKPTHAAPLFANRRDAGRRLARELLGLRDARPVIVAVPRGGAPVAEEVARALDAPLDLCVVRKIAGASAPEVGLGAVAEGGEVTLLPHVERLGVETADLEPLLRARRAELDARVETLRGSRPPMDLRGRTVVVVDDGLAMGGTARAALQAVRRRGASRVVLAVPVGAAEGLHGLEDADEVICPFALPDLGCVGHWYEDFSETDDAEVLSILARRSGPTARRRLRRKASTVVVEAAGARLDAELDLPPTARAVVVFANGGGSGRASPRDAWVAAELARAGLGTLRLDLATRAERADERTSERVRFDVRLLGARLAGAIDWLTQRAPLVMGCCGSSTGAAAALVAATERPAAVRAVVCRGGRPDLADDALSRVEAPTLLIVGGHDRAGLSVHKRALARLRGERELLVVPGATHLFEEPGALDEVARLATEWFIRHLLPDAGRRARP